MPDEVLRMRATVSSEEALASIRAIGKEFGLLPRQAKPPIDSLNQSFNNLGNTIRRMGTELRAAIPALGGFGLGAAGIGLAAGALIRTLSSVAEKIVQLKYRSQELGIAEGALRGFSEAAAKAGISPDTFNASLSRFKRNTEDFKLRIGGVREELIRMGAGPVVQRINAATGTLDKLKVAFDFKQTLDKLDPSGDRGRRFFEDIGLGAEAARLSFDALAKSIKPALTEKEKADAKAFHDSLIELGSAWDKVLTKTGAQLFPGLATTLREIQAILDALERVSDWMSKRGEQGKMSTEGLETIPWEDFASKKFGIAPGKNPLLAPTVPGGGTQGGGFSPIAFREGFQGGADLSEGSRMVKEGVFAALVEFQSYVTGAPAAGGGAQRASFGGISGGWSGGSMPAGSAPAGSATANLTPGTGGSAGAQPMGSLPGADAHGARPMESRGGSAGITAPAGTAIQKEGMATVTTAGGRKFQVDARFAQNFQGFINDYEKAGGVIGPESGTLGHRPHNPSGHPIGAAIDINQVGYGVRGRGGKTLPVEVENALAAKWGLVSGANWRKPDTGHFGIKDVATARQALIDQGLSPSEATEVAKDMAGQRAKAAGVTDGKTVKGSVFGSTHGFRDPSEPRGRKTASGQSNEVPGIALPDRSTLGQMFEVTTPDGRTFYLPQTDIGPGKRTGRGIDITSSAAAQMGYTSKTFPTGGKFAYRPLGAATAGVTGDEAQRTARIDGALGTNVNATGSVNVNITSNGTAAKADAKSDGIFQQSKITNYKQMAATDPQSSMVGAP